MIKVHYDKTTGNILGFYACELHKNMPALTVDITEEQHKNYFNKNQSFKVVDGAFTYVEPESIPLEILKKAKWQEIKIIREQKAQTGLPYMDKVLDIDSLSVQRIMTLVQAAQTAISQNKEFTVNWITQDNSVLFMAAQDICGVPLALAQFSNNLHAKAHSLREKIDKATTPEELAKIIWQD